MAGVLYLMSAENSEASSTAIKDQWEIEFSRFFNYPSISSTSPSLKPLLKSRRIRCRGTWILSSSTASLHLVTYHSNPEGILVVSNRGRIHEEHFISKLHFSWPQVSCVAQCPTRGSRVLFANYRDCVGQIQKFALWFSTSCEAQTFINALKGSLKDVGYIGPSTNDFGSEISSKCEFISSNGHQFRADEEFSFVAPVDIYTPEMPPVLKYKDEEHTCSHETVLGHETYNAEGIFEALPPSFTALLTNCCAEAEQEQPAVPEEVDLQTQITRYMMDSSFHAMLSTVEKVINEMGDDLAL